MSGIERIAAERVRQMEAEGYTPEHDDAHAHGELAYAAACYILATRLNLHNNWLLRIINQLWPFVDAVLKRDDKERMLEKGGAFCAAELDRLERLGQGN